MARAHRSSRPCATPPRPPVLVEPGVVLLARMLQDDGVTTKDRPCVVLEETAEYLVVHPLTASSLAPGRLAHELIDWAGAGLNRPSAVLLHHVHLSHRDVLARVGVLSADDLAAVRAGLVSVVSAVPGAPRG